MSSPMLIKRLITGILCASMVLQSVPISVSAHEDGEIVDETAILAVEPETAADEAGLERIETAASDMGASEIKETDIKETEAEEAKTEESNIYEAETESSVLPEKTEELGVVNGSEEAVDVDMTLEFPDELFRAKVIDSIKPESIRPDGRVTKDMLAEIEAIDFSRKSYADPAIRVIDGIEHLTGIKRIDLSYNEIASVVKDEAGKLIEWENLALLESINLDGNNISDIPNFYRNNKLKSVSLIENLLTDRQISDFLKSNIPPSSGIKLADETVFSQRPQREGDFKVQLEPVYYVCGAGEGKLVPFSIMAGGYKSKLAYKLEFEIDGNEVTPARKVINSKEYENIYYIEDSGLSEGEHSILIKLEQNGKVSELRETFNVASQDCYPIKNVYRFSKIQPDDVVDLYYTYSTTNRIDYLTLTDANGKEFTYPGVSFAQSVETKDYRYKDIEGNPGLYIKENYMNHAAFSMKNTINLIPTGVYSLNVFFREGASPYVLRDLIHVTSSVNDNWQCDLSSETLYYNDSQRKTAEITVTGTEKTVKFELEKTEGTPVNLVTDKDNPKKAVITAGDGEGSAVIKITAGNSVQRKRVEVKERIYAASIDIDTTEFKLDGIDRTRYVNVTIGPKEALFIREELEVAVSDSKVFVVEKQDLTESGVRLSVKSKGTGTARLTVKVKDSALPAVSCVITVVEGSFSELEKQTLIKNAGTVYCITNINGTRLGDLPLPIGWEWVSPDMIVSVKDAPEEVQRYTARYSKKNYTSFNAPLPVAVTQITGVEVSGPNELSKGKDGEYTAKLKYKGYYVWSNKAFSDALSKAVSFNWSSDPVFTLSKRNGMSVTAAAGSVNAVTAGIITVSAKVKNDAFTAYYDVRVIPEHITKIIITPTKTGANKPVPYEYNESESVVYVDEAKVTGDAYKIKFEVEASIDGREVDVKKGTFKWEINNPALGEIKEADDGTVQLHINLNKKSGTIILRATADDARKNYEEIAVELRDYSPIFETDTITIYKYAKDGTALPIYPVEGNEITSIKVDNSNFKVEPYDNAEADNGLWHMQIMNAGLYQKNTVVEAQLTINTKMISEIKRDVKLVIDTSRPRIKFAAKTAPNLFYADTTAQYKIDAEYEILDIKQTGDEDENKKRVGFNLKSYDRKTGVLTVEANRLSKATLDEFKDRNSDCCNIPLLITYKGYGTVEESLKVSAKSIKPSIKAEETAITAGITTASQIADTYLTDTKTKKKFDLNNASKVSSLTGTVAAARKDKGVALAYTGAKSIGYKLLISDEKWTEDINVSGRISIVKSLSTLLDKKSICLNMAHSIEKNGSVPVGVSVKNSLIDIADVKCEAADKKTAPLVESGYLGISYDAANDILHVGINGDIQPQIKAGSYKLNVYANVKNAADETVELAPAVLTISLADAAKTPKVKLSGKGAINLADRANTAVVYTAAVSNMTSNIISVKATGENAKLFEAGIIDGRIEVKAKAADEAVINIGNYVLGLELGFENETTIPVSVRIKPVYKTPKLETSKKSGTIYKASGNDFKWKLYNRGGFGEITGVTLMDSKVKQPFKITSFIDNVITLKLADEVKRTVKKGKYTVTYQVHFSGMPLDAKPVIMKMSVIVK